MFVGLVLAGRYELIEKLGAGGMGSVWRARDRTLNADVAIKLIGAQFVESPLAVARFRREAQAAAAIRSTHVVQILDHGVDDGTPFIAMELLKGESLAQRLRRAGALTPELTGRFMTQVARALALAHGNDIVHRDMKPDNIFLVREDEEVLAKVLDFGVARKSEGFSDSAGLKTKTGAILGTPYYMSPEQATGQAVDHLTDIWSFGVIACECLTGRRAFAADSLGGLFHAICMAAMPVPSQLSPVPPGFDVWFARAAARDAAARFPTIKEAADELRVICGHNISQSSSVSVPVESADTMQSPGVAQLVAGLPRVAASSTVIQTTDPSSRSIASSPKANRASTKFIVLVVAALVVGVLLASWRWLMRPSVNVSASAVAGSQTSAAVPETTPQTSVNAAQAPLPAAAPSADERPVELARETSVSENARKVKSPKLEASARVSQPAPSPAIEEKPKPRVEKQVTDDNAAGI